MSELTPKKIDILIPTYNRISYLEKNLARLTSMAHKNNLRAQINIIVSNNNSSDKTKELLMEFSKKYSYVYVYNQEKNIGLEKNAVFCLDKAKSDYVMYLGDDDYLPENYLNEILNFIRDGEKFSAIIPGAVENYSDRKSIVLRSAKFDKKKYKKSFINELKLICYGHQLSGLVLLRDGILKRYLASNNRNIYPFISFLGFNVKRGNVIYLPQYKVEITKGNKKDWSYDESGLIFDVFKNFEILYPQNNIKRSLHQIYFLMQQNWRFRFKNFQSLSNTLKLFFNSQKVESLTKVFLPVLILVSSINKFHRKIRN